MARVGLVEFARETVRSGSRLVPHEIPSNIFLIVPAQGPLSTSDSMARVGLVEFARETVRSGPASGGSRLLFGLGDRVNEKYY